MRVSLPYLLQIQGTRGTEEETTARQDGDDTASPNTQGLKQSLGGWVAQTLKQLVAGVMTGYHTEHNDDDTHKTIHATGNIYERDRTVAIGDWVDTPFSATTFGGGSAMTWTVTTTQQTAYSYLRIGTTLYLNYWIEGGTIGGTASASLKLTLPASLVVSQYATAPMHYTNSGSGHGFVTATPGDRFLALSKADSSNWTAGTVTVHGQLAVKVADDTGDATVVSVDPVVTYTGGSHSFASSTALAFTTAGTYTLTANRAMTLTVKGVAGGGSGGGSQGSQSGGGGGGGGASDLVGESVHLVTGKTYTVVVGAGSTNVSGGSGGLSSFVNTTDSVTIFSLAGGGAGGTVTAGAGGTVTTGPNAVAGGAGGAGGDSVGGTVSQAGAAGSGGATTSGGGGGGGTGGSPGPQGGGTSGGSAGVAKASDGANGAFVVNGGGTGGSGGFGAHLNSTGYGGGGGGGGGADNGGSQGSSGAGQNGIVLFTFVSAP